MKTKIYIIILFTLAQLQIDAQLLVNGNNQNFFGQLDNNPINTDNWTRSIGIGYFGSGFPNSFLHINSNISLLPANGSIANYGEVFRTNAPADVTTAWRMLSGNVSANEKFNIRNTSGTNNVVLGTVQSGHLDFHTNNTFRGGVTSDGALYFSGTSGATPVTGAGTRMMWIPDKAAFRAGAVGVGGVGAGQWDAANVGLYSIAFGANTQASGEGAISLGFGGYSSGHASICVGNGNAATADNAVAFGKLNTVNGLNSMALGQGTLVNSVNSAAVGYNNILNTSTGIGGNLAVGAGNNINADFCFAFGIQNTITGSVNPCLTSTAIGCNNNITGATNAHCSGHFLEASANGAFVTGIGISGNLLTNNINNSLMAGFNSNVPTFFVGPSAGSGTWGNVGFGNITAPTELIDANGNARLRDMPVGAGNVLVTGVQESGVGDYSLSTIPLGLAGQYLDGTGTFVNMPPAEQCDWVVNSQNILMGYSSGSPSACRTGNVGIGTPSPSSKLTVYGQMSSTGQGASITTLAASAIMNTAIRSSATGGSQGITGISSEAVANANSSSGTATIIGVSGRGLSNPSSTDYTGYDAVYGVYGSTTGAASGTDYYAGYFAGDVYSTGSYLPSDEALKSNIQPAGSSLDKLATLEVKTYEYSSEEFPTMNLPQGEQTGFIASNLEEAFPELVKGATQPAETDDEGNVTSEAVSFNAVNYVGLIPHLVGSVQELKSIIETQQVQIQTMAEQLAACCANSDKSNPGASKAGATYGNGYDLRIERATLDQNVPNPFHSETSITYRIPAQAQVRVRILGQDGSQKDILVDGLMPLGEYRIIWNAAHLPAGTYYYTLEADGVELVKKAVKL